MKYACGIGGVGGAVPQHQLPAGLRLRGWRGSEKPHSRLQRAIISFFIRRYPHLEDLLYPEQRVQVKPTRFRISDLCLLSADPAEEPAIVRTPPLLCIEILSKDDSLADIALRVDDYLGMGVQTCWIIDPLTREAWTASRVGELDRVAEGILRAGEVEMPLEEVLPPVE